MLEDKTIMLDDGCVFTGWFYDTERVFGTKTYPNGATYTGPYENNLRHGTGIKTHADGTQVLVTYQHGKRL